MFETDAIYQNDPRWKNVKLGNQNKETIGSWGCLLTSITMVANGYGYQETPETMNSKMKAKGGYQGALIIPAVLPSIFPDLIYKGYQPCEDTPAPINEIDASIASGKPVIVQVDWSPKAGLQTHWIVLYDKSGDDYYMKDPYRYSGDAPDKKIRVLDRYDHSGNDIAKAITGVIWIEGSSPPEPKPKVPLPADSFTVYAAADGLAFRSNPSVTADLIGRMPLNAMFETLENKSEAEAKVGVRGEWLHVQDSSGAQGYTAAWYLSKTVVDEVEAPTDQKTPTPDDIEFYLTPIANGLALRTSPDYNAQLIKRLPLNTKLGYLESRASVNNKVGVTNQWIHVYDESGTQGYTAAWYVARKAGKSPSKFGEIETPPSPPDQNEPKAPPIPIKGFAVVPILDGLAFRTAPTIAEATLIKRLHLMTKLGVEEPENQARKKIGVKGQWLKVKDASGQVGYVAAWYVKTAPQPESGDESGSGEDIMVRTTVEGVALRRSANIADHTLIKRLPNNSPVVILEPEDVSKIGEHGQWLRVRDSSGTEGYIASWLVAR